MRLYLVERKDEWNYDEFDAVVVAAQTEKQAKAILPADFSGVPGYWREDVLKVTYIGETMREAGVVLASFRAG